MCALQNSRCTRGPRMTSLAPVRGHEGWTLSPDTSTTQSLPCSMWCQRKDAQTTQVHRHCVPGKVPQGRQQADSVGSSGGQGHVEQQSRTERSWLPSPRPWAHPPMWLDYRDSLVMTALALGAHSPLWHARPVSRRRWVLLVRVALGGFLVESWARRGRFLFTFLRLCACRDAVRLEIR